MLSDVPLKKKMACFVMITMPYLCRAQTDATSVLHAMTVLTNCRWIAGYTVATQETWLPVMEFTWNTYARRPRTWTNSIANCWRREPPREVPPSGSTLLLHPRYPSFPFLYGELYRTKMVGTHSYAQEATPRVSSTENIFNSYTSTVLSLKITSVGSALQAVLIQRISLRLLHQ